MPHFKHLLDHGGHFCAVQDVLALQILMQKHQQQTKLWTFDQVDALVKENISIAFMSMKITFTKLLLTMRFMRWQC